MAIRLSDLANERSTYPIRLTFVDQLDGPVTPSPLTWTLTDADGAVVNSRSAVSVTASAGSALIVLSGADLAVSGSKPVDRVVTVEGTYTSTYGADLPIKEEVWFSVVPLMKVGP